MKKSFFIVLTFLFTHTGIYSQNIINFYVDASNLIKNEDFLPLSGDTLVIRGSFNGWAGNEQILKDVDEDSIYSLTYRIEGYVGDTVQYKFVIVKSEGFERHSQRYIKTAGNRSGRAHGRGFDARPDCQ